MIYVVTAVATEHKGGAQTSRQIPAFEVEAASRMGAERKARQILTAGGSNPAITIVVSVEPV